MWTTQFLYVKLCQARLHLEVKASSSATAVVPSVVTQIAESVSRQNKSVTRDAAIASTVAINRQHVGRL